MVEGMAEDGTIEAIRIADAPAFALGVQWHAEYDPQRNPINRALFQAFGEALLEHQRVAILPIPPPRNARGGCIGDVRSPFLHRTPMHASAMREATVGCDYRPSRGQSSVISYPTTDRSRSPTIPAFR